MWRDRNFDGDGASSTRGVSSALAYPPSIIAGLLLAVPTLLLRRQGWILDVETTVQQLGMVAFFTSIGFSVDRRTLAAGWQARGADPGNGRRGSTCTEHCGYRLGSHAGFESSPWNCGRCYGACRRTRH